MMRASILLLIGIWTGLVLGLSFVEAPLKFQAPGITTKLGLGIGRLVFGYSNTIQLIFLALVSSYLFYHLDSLFKRTKILLGILFVLAGIQTFYLLPTLDGRAIQILNNQSVPESHHHLYFVGLEVMKVVSLVLLFNNLYKRWKT